jgi:hypothetical protein
VARLRPDLRVLVVSGYSDAVGLEPHLPRLEKPFRQVDLASQIALLMSRQPDGTRLH